MMKTICPYCREMIDDVDMQKIFDTEESFADIPGIETLYEDWEYRYQCPFCKEIFNFNIQFKINPSKRDYESNVFNPDWDDDTDLGE